MSLILDSDGTCLLVVHVGDVIETVVARFEDVQTADAYAQLVVDCTFSTKGVAPAYGGRNTLRKMPSDQSHARHDLIGRTPPSIF